MYGDLEKLVNPEKGGNKRYGDEKMRRGQYQNTNSTSSCKHEYGFERHNKKGQSKLNEKSFGNRRQAHPSLREEINGLSQQTKQSCALTGHDVHGKFHKHRPLKHPAPRFRPTPPEYYRPCYDFQQPSNEKYSHGSKLCPPDDPHVDHSKSTSECEKKSGSSTANVRTSFPQRDPVEIIESMRGEYHPDVRDPSNTQLSIAIREWDQSALEHGCRLLEQKVGKKKAARVAGVLLGDLMEYWDLHYGFSDSDSD